MLCYNFRPVEFNLPKSSGSSLRVEVGERTYIGGSVPRGLDLGGPRFPERDSSKSVSVFVWVVNSVSHHYSLVKERKT